MYSYIGHLTTGFVKIFLFPIIIIIIIIIIIKTLNNKNR